MGLQATIQAGIVTAFEAADDLVAEVWLTRQVAGVYDSGTGDVPSTEATYKFDGIIDEVKETGSASGDAGSTGGSEVEQVDLLAYLMPGQTDPVRGDILRVGETKYRVVTVDPLKPDGVTVLLWTLGIAI